MLYGAQRLVCCVQECTFKPTLAPPRRRSRSAGVKGPVPATPAAAQPAARGDGSADAEATPSVVGDATPAAQQPWSAAPPRAATGQRSAASARASAASLHRSMDHEKYTSLEAQVRF